MNYLKRPVTIKVLLTFVGVPALFFAALTVFLISYKLNLLSADGVYTKASAAVNFIQIPLYTGLACTWYKASVDTRSKLTIWVLSMGAGYAWWLLLSPSSPFATGVPVVLSVTMLRSRAKRMDVAI